MFFPHSPVQCLDVIIVRPAKHPPTRLYSAVMFARSLKVRGISAKVGRSALRSQCLKYSVQAGNATEYESFLTSVAKVEPPSRLSTLLDLIVLKGDTLVDPRDRAGLNPFLIPISRDKADQSLLCYIRWPTQREEMPLQLVRTTQSGVRLVSLSTDNLCHRYAVEMDFRNEPTAVDAIEKLNKDSQLYNPGDYNTYLRSGKFATDTEKERSLVLDRYLLTKVGPFPDCYERLAQNFKDKDNIVSALITCERSVSLFYSWGHPLHFHTKMLRDAGRPHECLEAARSAMGLPKWTLASDQTDLDEAIKLAGFSKTSIVGEMHAFRSTDPREKDIGEGHNPIQIILDQAAHLMDAVALGAVPGGWDAARAGIAQRYRDAGYPEMADFIET